MEFIDVFLIVVIILFIILIVWSKLMGQRMYDTIMEIRDIAKDIVKGGAQK